MVSGQGKARFRGAVVQALKRGEGVGQAIVGGDRSPECKLLTFLIKVLPPQT